LLPPPTGFTTWASFWLHVRQDARRWCVLACWSEPCSPLHASFDRTDRRLCRPSGRAATATGIGDPGPMGRILVRGEAATSSGTRPVPGEPVVDKPGKGAFYATDLEAMLRGRGITQLLVCGVTTEVCVNTTVREANDRGFDCLVLEDCTGSYFPEFHAAGIAMIKAQGGIFGWVAPSAALLAALA
jgi:nicotinamidase-related amidase